MALVFTSVEWVGKKAEVGTGNGWVAMTCGDLRAEVASKSGLGEGLGSQVFIQPRVISHYMGTSPGKSNELR